MRAASLIGIILIALGILVLAYQGITYTREETIFKAGPVEATAETEETIPLPPILGGLSLVGGVVLLIYGTRRSKASH
ncbi:MAG: DUF3185 domain-containing protein [Acidobacteria bacterium]|nr:DUF3185 domain-containing protein [Acidobacteriota bacterium]